MKKAFKKIFGSNGKDDATKKPTSQPGADQRPPAQHQQPHQHQFDYPERHQLEIQQLLAESADKMRRQERQTTGNKPERGVRCPDTGRWITESELIAMEQMKAAEKRKQFPTDRSQELPAASAASACPGAGPAGPAAQYQRSPTPVQNPSPSLQREDSIPMPPPQDELPPGWKSTVDPATGRQYFYNKQLGKTTWVRPTSDSEAQQNAPAPARAPAPSPAQGTLCEEDLQLYQAMQEHLEAYTAEVKDRMLKARGIGNKPEYLQHGLEYKYHMQLLEWLKMRREKGMPIPETRRIQRSVTKNDVNAAVPESTMRVTVRQVMDLDTSDMIQLALFLQWPKDKPRQEFSSEPMKNGDDFKEWTVDFEVPRTKRLQVSANRIKLQLEVSEVRKNFFSTKTTPLGQAEIELGALKSTSTLTRDAVPLQDSANRSTSGKLAVEVKIKKPWSGQDTEKTVTETVVILVEQSHGGDPPPTKPKGLEAEHRRLIAAADALPLSSGTPIVGLAGGAAMPGGPQRPASAALGNPSRENNKAAAKLKPAELEAKYSQGKKFFDASSARVGESTVEQANQHCTENLLKAQKLLLEVKAGSSTPYRNTNQTLMHIQQRLEALKINPQPSAVHSIEPDEFRGEGGEGSPGSGNLEAEEEDYTEVEQVAAGGGLAQELEEWDAVENIKSFAVYELEEKYCDAMLQRAVVCKGEVAEPVQWEIRRESIISAKENMEFKIENNILQEHQYIEQVRAALQQSMGFHVKLQTAGRQNDVGRLNSWINAMRDELTQAGIPLPLPPAAPSPSSQASAQPPPSRPAAATAAGGAGAQAVQAARASVPAAAAVAAHAGAGGAGGGNVQPAPAMHAPADDGEGVYSGFMSFGLLTHEIAKIDALLATAPESKADLLAMKEAFEEKLETLEFQIEHNTLSEEEYKRQTEEVIKRETARANKFKASGKSEEYKEALGRLKAMTDELRG